ncbi:hypothetical protein AJ78_03828 [Emergomyces pasteurianus Ep9510]|uniref:ADF-H domain-containing protein n=1 Tax=Emergomyces pasteurianus Ep9510 TaxID=1447872 RepID=A0A1J9QIG2_9EURO|nr:hypothetical protein AJ78_03828 [Emergomyces pasteurianus Ep9510]
MSLNGLDDPTVIESYQSALAEAGGWFLLKYVSRDTVALLARGTGGVTEIRITIDGYEETSPLYGFLQYRRRKIILKYVPEGISRLIQARITVQFQSILDKFSPHDTVFSLAVSSELTESALSSACLLHTASSSMTSSSSSLRRRRLGEITEDAEECASPKEETYGHLDNGYRNRRESVFSGTSDATAVPSHHKRGQGSGDTSRTDVSRPPGDDRSGSAADKPLPSVPRNRTDSQSTGHAQRHFLDSLAHSPPDSRKSSQSTRPSLRDLDSISLYRPKVKLGPRPSMDPSGRPRTAGSIGRSNDTRPVASLPAGVRMSTRKNGSSVGRPKSQPDIPVPRLPPSMAPPVPHLLIPPPPLNLGPMSRHAPGSPRSVMSVPSSLSITPEKQRLMRALELRKKQMEKRVDKTEKKNNEPFSEPKQAVKTLDVEGSKQNIKIEQMEITTKPAQDEVTSIEPDAEVPQQPTPQSKQAQHPASITPVEEKEQTPPSPDPSNPDSAVDVGAVEPRNIHPASSSASVMSAVSSDVEGKRSSLTISVNTPDTSKNGEEEGVCEASEPDQANPPIVGFAQNQSHDNNESELTQVAEPPAEPTGDLKVSVVEVPVGISSPNATPRAIPRDRVNGTCSPDEDATPRTPEMPLTPIAQESPQSRTLSASPASHKSTEELSVKSASDMSKSNESSPEKEPSVANKLKSRRNGLMDPIHVVTQFDQSDEDNLLSDDSFMDELGSATFQEAKPIAVPKTPSGASFAKNGDSESALDWKNSRAVSNPNNARNTVSDVQALPIGRSASGSFLESQKAVPVLVAKKVNVSSGISKRIKALEMFSSREGQPPAGPQPPPPTSVSSSSFEKFRNRASISQPSLPTPSTLTSKPQSYTPSHSPSERRALSPNPPKRADSQSTHTQSRGKSNSVSVTARIIRDPAAPPSEHPADPSEPGVLNLQRSPLIVESETPQSSRRPSTSTVTRPEKRSVSNSSSSGSGRTSTAQGMPRSDSITSRISTSSRPRHEAHSPHPSPDAPYSQLDRVDESKEERKESRKSRIIRRMSSITSNSRRGIINALSPTLKEEESQMASLNDEEGSTPEPPQVVEIGEVNVQFPDTLLWKRRFMRIDDQGYLILTPGTIDGTARNIVKRYHLSEFRPPTLPDQDRQELPNSIVLDFLDGSTLQCACESRQGQGSILQVLLDAHSSYEQVFPRQ